MDVLSLWSSNGDPLEISIETKLQCTAVLIQPVLYQTAETQVIQGRDWRLIQGSQRTLSMLMIITRKEHDYPIQWAFLFAESNVLLVLLPWNASNNLWLQIMKGDPGLYSVT